MSKEVLFNEAYEHYLECVTIIEKSAEETLKHGYLAMFDMFVQLHLLDIGFADGNINESERDFIVKLVNSYNLLCKRIKGYRVFVNTCTYDEIQVMRKTEDFQNASKVLHGISAFLDKEKIAYLVLKLQNIFRCFIEYDGDVKVEEQGLADEIIAQIRREHDIEVVAEEIEPSRQGMDELEALIGLDSVKKEVLEFLNLTRVNKLKREKGLPEIHVSKHMVFTGNPGTGKTTIARILAQLYKENGIVSKGQLIETDRSGLVDTIIGGTAQKVKSNVKKALGGILFIDEAYSLAPEDAGRDFGPEAIATLVKMMEDYRDDLIVIVAGYKEEMEHFINSNTGLKSRFKKFIHFPDYTEEELDAIFHAMAERDGCIVSKSAEKKLKKVWSSVGSQKTFGNARGVRNVYEQTITHQATRIIEQNITDSEDIQTIIADDIIIE